MSGKTKQGKPPSPQWPFQKGFTSFCAVRSAGVGGAFACAWAAVLRPSFFNFRRCFAISVMEHQINEEIREKEVRLIDSEGRQLGVVPLQKALEAAEEKGLDLVNISPKAVPPVCKIMDYGKFRF